MKNYITSVFFLFISLFSYSQNNTWGVVGNAFEYTQGLTGTGIQKVYVFADLSASEVTFTTNASVVKFYKYENSISEKEIVPNSDISSIGNGGQMTYNIRNLEDSKGYFAEIDGGVSAVVWVVDYSKHTPQLSGIQIEESEDRCEYLKLIIDKSDDLFFYANNGARRMIRRLYDIEYLNLVYDDRNKQFVEKIEEIKEVEIGLDWVVNAPLTDTQFRLSGDQFAKYFGLDFHLESQPYSAVAVEPYMLVEQVDENAEGGITSELGGSAPAEIYFYGVGNEPVAHYYTWNIYKTTDPKNSIVRYTDKNIKYTFKDAGSYLVKLEIADRTSFCADTVSVSFEITDFVLKVPNYLLLDGMHEFKVTYESIFNFKCTIFNRWGNKIYEWKDPSQGWDGKYKGKYVSTGAYYYIITAESGDGKKHKRSGAINVLKPR